MTAPSVIRVNASAPFPTLTIGSGPVVVTKVNGIWTIGLSVAALAVAMPAPGNYPTDLLIFFDTLAKSWSSISLQTIVNAASAASSVRTQRSVTSAPSVQAGDAIINFNLGVASNLALPTASSRAGTPLTLNDAGGQFGAFPLTVTPNGGDTIAGQFTNAVPLVLRAPRQVVTLVPYNDGINSGWFIA